MSRVSYARELEYENAIENAPFSLGPCSCGCTRCLRRERGSLEWPSPIREAEWTWLPASAAKRVLGGRSGPAQTPSPPPVSRSGQVLSFALEGIDSGRMRFAVYVPAKGASQRSVDVVVYVHGRPETCKPIAKDPEDLIKKAPFSLGSAFDKAGSDAVLVVPLLDDWTRSGVLGDPSKLERIVVEALKTIGGSGKPPSVNRLILSGHSGAYRFLDAVAKKFGATEMKRDPLAKISEIWGFDTSYSCPSDDWKKWLKAWKGLTLRLFYIGESDKTSACGKAFGRLSLDPDIGRQVVVTPVDDDHCKMVAKRLPDLLGPLKPSGSNPEFEVEREQLGPVVARICAISAGIANQARYALRGLPGNGALWRAEAIRSRAAEQVNRLGRQLIPLLRHLHREEVDLLAVCLGRVEHAIGRETLPMRRFRAAARQRLQAP